MKKRTKDTSPQVRAFRFDGDFGGEGTGHLTGYALVFGQKTSIRDAFGEYDEIIHRGAADRTIQNGSKVVALKNHDPNFVLGATTTKGEEGRLRLVADDHGVKVDLNYLDTTAAQDARKEALSGAVDKMSFRFLPVAGKEKWSVQADGRELREHFELKILDVAPVVFPAYEGTSMDARDATPETKEISEEEAPPKEEKREETPEEDSEPKPDSATEANRAQFHRELAQTQRREELEL